MSSVYEWRVSWFWMGGLLLLVAVGCGKAEYDSKMEARIQQLRARAEVPAEDQAEEGEGDTQDGSADAGDLDADLDRDNAADEDAADEEPQDDEMLDEDAVADE